MEGSFDLSHDAFDCAPPDDNTSRGSVHCCSGDDGKGRSGEGEEEGERGRTIVSEFEQTNTSLSHGELVSKAIYQKRRSVCEIEGCMRGRKGEGREGEDGPTTSMSDLGNPSMVSNDELIVDCSYTTRPNDRISSPSSSRTHLRQTHSLQSSPVSLLPSQPNPTQDIVSSNVEESE